MKYEYKTMMVIFYEEDSVEKVNEHYKDGWEPFLQTQILPGRLIITIRRPIEPKTSL